MVGCKKQKYGLFFIDKEGIIAYNLLSFFSPTLKELRRCKIWLEHPVPEGSGKLQNEFLLK